jgi:GntR family transcriptional regulator
LIYINSTVSAVFIYTFLAYNLYKYRNLDMSPSRRVPLYEQIEAVLRERIHALQPGDRLPSDRDLADEFGVSFITARQAVSRLAADGLVTRQVGRGTFVAAPRLEKDMRGLTSFSEDMRERGLTVRSEVLECSVGPATSEVAQALQILEGSPVMRLRRVRFADEIPMAIESAAVSVLAFPGLADEDFAHQSLYETLSRRYRVNLVVARGTLSAVAPSKEEAKLLRIARNVPLLVDRRTAFNEHFEPIEYGESRYRSDRYQVPVEMWWASHGSRWSVRQPEPGSQELDAVR